MTRGQLFKRRLLLSAGLLLPLFALVRLLWYPGGFFAISGVAKLFLVLLLVSFVVGSALSAFVYKPGKKGLTMDLWVLAGIEVVAIAVATSVIYARQPYYTVFAVDRFEVVARNEIADQAAVATRFQGRPGHAPRLIYAEMPTDPEVLSRLIDETVTEGKADIDRRPEFWKPYTAGIPVIKGAAKPLAKLLDGDSRRTARVLRWLASQPAGRDDFVYLPIRGKAGDAALILHADIGFPVEILIVDPW